VLHVARWKYRTQNDPKNRHLRTIAQLCRAMSSQLRRVSTIGKIVKQQYLPTRPHNMVNFGPLASEIGSGVLGHSSKLNSFHDLASLLQRRRSPEANQTLHDVCPSPGLVQDIYIFGGSCPLAEFCPVQNSLYVQVLRSPYIGSVTARHSSPAAASPKLCGVVQGMEVPNFRRGCHLCSAGRRSRWASAHILVFLFLCHFICSILSFSRTVYCFILLSLYRYRAPCNIFVFYACAGSGSVQ